jgi:hypothetical protein
MLFLVFSCFAISNIFFLSYLIIKFLLKRYDCFNFTQIDSFNFAKKNNIADVINYTYTYGKICNMGRKYAFSKIQHKFLFHVFYA